MPAGWLGLNPRTLARSARRVFETHHPRCVDRSLQIGIPGSLTRAPRGWNRTIGDVTRDRGIGPIDGPIHVPMLHRIVMDVIDVSVNVHFIANPMLVTRRVSRASPRATASKTRSFKPIVSVRPRPNDQAKRIIDRPRWVSRTLLPLWLKPVYNLPNNYTAGSRPRSPSESVACSSSGGWKREPGRRTLRLTLGPCGSFGPIQAPMASTRRLAMV